MILLVEDNAETAAYVSDGLGALGQTVEIASDGRAGLLRASEPQFDCLVIDRLLPGFDGLTVVRTLRGAGVRTPIIFLTAVGGVADRVQGLKASADDYLVKPFELEELAARVEALRRRPPLPESQMLLRTVDMSWTGWGGPPSAPGRRWTSRAASSGSWELLMLNAAYAVTRSMLLQTVFGLSSP